MDTEKNEVMVEETVSADNGENNAEAPAREGYAQRNASRVPNRRRKKVCAFCADKIDYIDYKDTLRLRKFVSERAKILPRRTTGTCAYHQTQLTTAIKRARHCALLPYVNN